nr:Protein DMSR-8 [Haemonchus contortus]
MDLNTLENITSDQLQALNSLRFSLNDLRAEAQNDADKEQLPFEGEPRNRLDSMQKFNLDIQDAVRNALHGEAPAPVQDAGEGTPKVRGEDEIIRENEEFIEGLIESGSEHDDHDDQVSVDEDMGSDSAHDDLSEAEGSEEEPEEVWQEEPDEPEQEEPEDLDEDQRELEDEDDIPEEFPRRENLRRRAIQIENEIRSTEQAIHNFEEILRQKFLKDWPALAELEMSRHKPSGLTGLTRSEQLALTSHRVSATSMLIHATAKESTSKIAVSFDAHPATDLMARNSLEIHEIRLVAPNMNKQDLGFFSNTMSKIRHFWENGTNAIESSPQRRINLIKCETQY